MGVTYDNKIAFMCNPGGSDNWDGADSNACPEVFTDGGWDVAYEHTGDRWTVTFTVTDRPQEVCDIISKELDRGSTVLEASGGYTGGGYTGGGYTGGGYTGGGYTGGGSGYTGRYR